MNEKILELAKKEKRPFYVFDTNILKKRVDYIRSFLPENVDICYAVKANTFVIKELRDMINRFEICSPGEAHICQKLEVKSECQVISGIYKTPEFIESLFKIGDFKGIFTIESFEQFKLIKELSKKYRFKVKLLLRLTNTSQFGMDKDLVEELISNLISYDLDNEYLELLGIQYFSGTQKTSIKKYARELNMLDSFIEELKVKYNYIPKELEYGTGFPVSYFESDDLNEEELMSEFASLIKEMRYKGKIILEIGRSIAASCGYYFTNIVDYKSNKGQNYVITDGGMHQLTYYGQSMAMKKPFISLVSDRGIKGDKTWNICGSLCTMNDILAKDIQLGDVEIGDTLCFFNAGAYSMIEGISLFLSRDLPGIFILDKTNNLLKVRDNFETEDLNLPNYI